MENINASVLIFKNGDQVICDLKEIYEGEGEERKGICLLMLHPYLLTLVPTNPQDLNQDLQIRFSRWCPYSSDIQFKVAYDSIISLGIPEEHLKQAFISKVEQVESYLREKQQANESIDQIIEDVESENE